MIGSGFILKIFYQQERVQAKDPPSHYLTKLRTYLDPKASRSHRVSTHFDNKIIGLLSFSCLNRL